MGTLFIVATPIGNLQDITQRAVETLKEVEYIACEDTRITARLLKSINAGHKYLISYFEGNEDKRIPNIINLLKNGKNVVLVSDSGTPTISDPGFRLVREALREYIPVKTIPGPSAVVAGLSVSGLPTDKFIFLGFPPQKSSNKLKLFKNLKSSLEFIEATVVLYESPHKIARTLQSLLSVFGDIEIVIERELTKIYEERKIQKISQFMNDFSKKAPKGEIIILFSLKV